jgi:hypothetical protein
LRELEVERYGDNVHFLDGERLDALNEWATLQSDANARARLLGLRSALRFIITVLKEYQEHGKPKSQPLYIQGIELYLSEPVICDDQFLALMFNLWQQLQAIDTVRAILNKYLDKSAVLDNNAHYIVNAARGALPLAEMLCQKVDVAIEKMQPLGGG